MRPVRLVAQAFGPFADRIDIDFRPALAQRLFGIYGPTGAGKTSILDAVAFALFGESSGGERTRAHLRSDLADLESPTFVEFVFELGDKRYFVRREPEQALKSARKDSRVHPATAVVFDATGLEPGSIGLANPGRPLAVRKLREVDDVLCRLLGYDAEQFRQVVILPQGRFRQLLTADSDERSKILRGLFDVQIFERFAERLKTRAAGLEAEVRSALQEVQTRLADLGVATSEAVTTGIADRRAALTEAQEERRELDARRTAADTSLASGRALSDRFSEAESARGAVSALESRAAENDAIRARLARAEAARELGPMQAAAERARAEASEQAQAVDTATSAHAQAAEFADQAEKALAASNAQADVRCGLRLARERAAQISERVGAAEPLRARCTNAEEAVAGAQAARAEAETRVTDARTALAEADVALEEARGSAGALSALDLRLLTLRQAHASAEAYERQRALSERRGADLKRAETVFENDRRATVEAEARLASIRAGLEAAQAVRLAAGLQEGAPCPVCGAVEHPAPAHGASGDADFVTELREAEASAESARAVVSTSQAKVAEARALARDVEENLARLAAPERKAAELAAEIATAQVERDRLAAAPPTQAAEAARVAASNEAVEAEEALRKADAKLADSRAAAEGARVALVTELATVPEHLQSAEAARAHLASATKAEADAVTAHAAAEREAAVASQDLAVRAATLESRRENSARARKAAELAEQVLRAAAADRGLEGDALSAASADVSRIEDLSSQISGYEVALASARDRQARALAGLDGVAPPDLPRLEDDKAAADAAFEACVERAAAHEAELRAWVSAEGRLAEVERRRTDAEAAFAVVGELSRLSQGKNAVRMSLVDYAIAAVFEEVLAAANIRFGRMSDGRFEMRRKTSTQDARSRGGLEILVYDAHSGRERDAKTLSGGEGFMAALALALGLSDVVQAESGGVKLDAVFIDEGFGHLDEQSLDRALDTLRDLVGEARAVGVISHVDAVKGQIPAGFEVAQRLRGSHVVARTV